jgi:two-component system cell cycle sensor histidine kinase/response regulator CckA
MTVDKPQDVKGTFPGSSDPEELYRILFEEAADGLLVTDPDGRLVAVNLRGIHLVGYSREELVGMAAADLIPAEHPAPGPVPKGGSVGEWIATNERYIHHKDGGLMPVEISARTLSGGGLLRLVHDITARKRAEEALHKAHTELEQQVEERTSDLEQASRMLKILSNCNQAVMRATEEPALLHDVCRIIVELGGYPLVWVGFAEQDTAQTVRPVAQAGFEDGYLESVNITWADTERGQGPTGRAIRSGEPCVARDIQTDPNFAPWREDAMRRGYASSVALPLWSDNRVFGVLNIHAPVADAFHAEEVHLLMELASDLAFGIISLRERAERNRAEVAVRESEARYRAIVEAFDGLIYICSPDYRVEFMNRQLVERTGYDGTGELCYKVLHDLDSVCPWCVNEQVFAGETVRWEVQSPMDNRWYYVVNTPIYHADGSMSKQAMILDITERKQAEDELRQTREAALQFSEQLAALQEVINELSKAESSDDLCLLAVQLGRSRLGFDRVSIWFIEEHRGIMRGSFGTDERGELRDERKAQVEFRHEGLAWRLFSYKEPMALVEHCPLCDHLGREVGEGDNAVAALWDGDEVIGVICVDNLFTGQPIRERQLEVLRLYATTLGHLITRKRAEDELRASETRFRTFVDHAADAFFLHDSDGRGTILDVNRQACESLGYSREELIGRTAFDFDPGLDRSFVDQNRARLDAGEVLVFDTQHRRKDGTVFPVEIRVRPFWQGEHRFAVSLARDITERKQAQEALTLFRSLIDHANDIIEVADPETGRFLDMNERACLAHGYTREEYLALTVPQINAVVAARSWKETVEELRRSGSLIRESQHRRKDGSIFPVEININYVRLDRDYVLSVVRDITQRKQAEEALRESEQKYRFITEKMADAVWLMDMDFKPTFISPSVTRILGYTPEEIQVLSLNEVLTPESLEFAMKTIATELSPERLAPRPCERSVTVELEFRRKDGSPRCIESTITLLRDSEGRPSGLMGVGRDITERKRAELVQAAIHRLSEAAQTTLNLDELFASIHAIIAQLMPAQNFYIALYEAATETIHFPYYADKFDTTPPPQKKGRGLTDFVLRTGKPLLATPQVFEDLVQSGQVESLGAPAVDWLGVPLKIQRGETIGVMAVQTYTEDVRLGAPDQEVLELVSTQVAMAIERKRAEEALQRSEEKYRVLVENLNEVIFTVDRQGLFTYISPAIERYTGFSPDQVVGQPFTRFIHPDDLPGLMASFERSLAGQLEPFEFRVYGRDGTIRHMRTSSRTLVENGQVVGLTGVMSDITGRRQAEKALRESEERYRALYEDNPSMYFTVDPAGTVLSVNQFGCEQLGYTASELVGQSVLKVFHDEDKGAAAESVALCAQNLGQVFHWELRKVHRAGNVLWVKETARAMRGPDGQIVVFIVCEDITERKRAEEERENLQAQLFQAQKMEVLGRLAGGVAHDFNNMLFAILGHTELAIRLSSPSDPIHDYLKVIEESAYRSADLVRQLLAFARQQTVAPKVLDLNDTVASMLKMLRRLIGEDIHLVWMPGASLWPIKIDPSQIDQLLANLCVNARDAIASVGKVVIETRNAVFDEAYCAVHPGFVCGQFVLLAVSDDGCGMTQDIMDHLFEPFFTTKEVGKGTGLGLATVYGIVKQNEGFINVYSEPGRGSTFKIYLPPFEGEAVELMAASAAEIPKGRGETVLLVEDEAAILKVGQSILQELGYHVLTADTPGEALHQAEAHAGDIQLLITDVVMPEMSGWDLAQLLGKVRPALKVLFTSGYTADVISHRGVLDEGVHFLQKPFSMRDLAFKVREVLEQKSIETT